MAVITQRDVSPKILGAGSLAISGRSRGADCSTPSCAEPAAREPSPVCWTKVYLDASGRGPTDNFWWANGNSPTIDENNSRTRSCLGS